MNSWKFFRRNREQFGTKNVEMSAWTYFQLDNIRKQLEKRLERDLDMDEAISLLLEHGVFRD